VKLREKKYSFKSDNITMKCAHFKTHNTVICCVYVIIYFYKNMKHSDRR